MLVYSHIASAGDPEGNEMLVCTCSYAPDCCTFDHERFHELVARFEREGYSLYAAENKASAQMESDEELAAEDSMAAEADE